MVYMKLYVIRIDLYDAACVSKWIEPPAVENLFKSVKSVSKMMMDALPTKGPAAGVFYPTIQIKYFYY